MPPLSEQQILALRDLIVTPIIKGVEQKIEASNAHQLERIEQIVTEQASTKADVATLKEDVSELKRLRLKIFAACSLIATLVGLLWGSALDFARQHGWIR